jgi:hypothetical protein
MNLQDYAKLNKEESKFTSFYDRNIETAKKLLIGTVVAQLIGAFFSYFEVAKIMSAGNDLQTFTLTWFGYTILTLLILGFIEGGKRMALSSSALIYKLNRGKLNSEFYVWLIIGIIPIFGSFYFAVNGAISLFEKKDAMVELKDSKIDTYSDSLNTKYNTYITQTDLERKTLFDKNQELDLKISSSDYTDKEIIL